MNPTKSQLAFGKILSYRKYELFMERYRSAADDFIIPHVEKLPDNKARLLDIGSREGYLKYFCDNGKIDFHGIEINPRRREVCERLGYQMSSFDIERHIFPFETNSFDIVVASHVLEHLYQPEDTMKEILRVLRPGGIAIIGVPMHSCFIASILKLKEKIRPAALYDHHQFFCMKTLKKFFQNYEVIDIRGFRLISSRKRFGWEDNFSFYTWNTWFGKKYPSLTAEVNVVIRKSEKL